MKTVAFFILSLLLIAVGIGSFLYFTSYHSAFEADQACHAAQWEKFAESKDYGCDHDTETRQWLLYRQGIDHKAAVVIQRFSY
ncbi:MAG: hypothetical protein AB8E87_11075 [Prochlorococcus sp.]|nr:hypothetical protein [Prochlorococcaceae cyanobacterium Fu_MAG_50]